MLERTLVFVDTSYLLASFYNSWEEGARTQLEIDLPEVCAVLDRMITQQIGQPIQRQNWYDGIPDSGPHRYQRALRTVDGVQLRAGLLIETGQRRTQKAVDTRLVADMVLAAVRQQCSDMVLVSGDQDMIPGVVEASAMGIRVHLYGFSWDSMSNALRHKCDSITVLDPREDFAQCMQIQPLEGPLPPSVPPRITGETPCDAAASRDTDQTFTNHRVRGGAAPETPPECPEQICTETAEPPAPETTAGAEQRVSPAQFPPASMAAPKPRPAFPATPIPTPGDIAAGGAKQAAPSAHEACAETKQAQPTPGGREPVTPTNEPANPAAPATPAQATRVPEPEADDSADEPQEATAGAQAADEGSAPTSAGEEEAPKPTPKPAPNPSMMAPRRKLRSRYVPLPNEVWTSAGFQTPFDVGQQYATWWFNNVATDDQRDSAHVLSGGGLPPNVDRPLLQFACEALHEYTLSESQRVSLRDGFHTGIRAILIAGENS